VLGEKSPEIREKSALGPVPQRSVPRAAAQFTQDEMPMPDHPLFMSSQHVDLLNRRLVECEPVARLCSGLDRDLCLLYDLSDGPDGARVYWRTDFRRSGGIGFSLQRGAGAHDVVIAGRYWDVIDAVQGKSAMPAPQGAVNDIEKIMTLLTSQELRACAVPVVFPTRPADSLE
jgi:hypothetical protein